MNQNMLKMQEKRQSSVSTRNLTGCLSKLTFYLTCSKGIGHSICTYTSSIISGLAASQAFNTMRDLNWPFT